MTSRQERRSGERIIWFRLSLKRFPLALVVAGILILTIRFITAASSPFSTHPENIWLKQSPREGGPPGFFYEGSGAFDPYSNQWIHHAGHDGIPAGFNTFHGAVNQCGTGVNSTQRVRTPWPVFKFQDSLLFAANKCDSRCAPPSSCQSKVTLVASVAGVR